MAGIPTGVWTHPTGPRFEVTQQPDGWHIAVYPRRGARQPGATFVFDTDDQAAEKVGGLEAQGYVHQPDQTTTPADSGVDSQWTPGNMVGAVLLFLAILGLGMWILGD
ncbi:hypothetical protein [Micromonospora rosaria]|nr:hypothetical protein [Micromonospora rosaria]